MWTRVRLIYLVTLVQNQKSSSYNYSKDKKEQSCLELEIKKQISDKQLTEIFGDVEDKINEKGAYCQYSVNAGSNLE